MKKKKKNCAKHTFDTGIKNVLNKQPLKAQQYEKSNPIKKWAKDVNRQLNRGANIDGKQANENTLPIICHQRCAS